MDYTQDEINSMAERHIVVRNGEVFRPGTDCPGGYPEMMAAGCYGPCYGPYGLVISNVIKEPPCKAMGAVAK